MELEAGKSKIRALANPVSSEDLLPRLLAVTSPDSPIAQLVKNPSAMQDTPVGSIPGLGGSAGEGNCYPLQYSWAVLMAQLIKNPPAMRKTWVWSLGWEDPLGRENCYLLQNSGWENSMDCIVHGVVVSRTLLRGFHFPRGRRGQEALFCHFYGGTNPSYEGFTLTAAHPKAPPLNSITLQVRF